MEYELKPCPFCGGEAEIQNDNRFPDGKRVEAWEVYCSNDFCIMYRQDNVYYLSEEEAIKAWNTRINE